MNGLRNDCVTNSTINIDWAEALGENMEGYRAFEAFDCDECGREVVCSFFGEDEHRNIEPEITDEDGDDVSNDCTGYLCFEGPMMNYWYPVPISDCEEAAKAISHLPLCVVEFEGGDTGLALTGGGMDLSWEICRAFIALGFSPPVEFCDLPDMSGWEKYPYAAEVIKACRESCDMASHWAARKAKMLSGMEAKLTDANSQGATLNQ